MKKIQFPRPGKTRSFQEKFSAEGEFFGSREKKKGKGKYGRLPRILLCMLGGIALVVAIMLLGGLWKVTEVTAEDGQLYTASVVEQLADLEAGDAMLGFDSFAVVKRLKKSLPLLDHVKVRKHLNGKVTISFSEVTELYYTRHNANYYIISAEDREVLGVFSNPNEARRVGAVYLGLPEATRVRVGEKLSFINLPYEPDSVPEELVTYELETDVPEVEHAYVFDFVEALMASPLAPRVTGMELGDRYDIRLVLDGRILVKIGDMAELDRKLTMTERSLKDRAEAGKDDGSLPVLVDVSDPARIIHRASPDIQLPDWAKGLA